MQVTSPRTQPELKSLLQALERRLGELRAFHLGYFPAVTLTLIIVLVGIYLVWQGGHANPATVLLEQGAKNRALIVELGQAWRLLSANVLHASTWHLAANAFFLLNIGGTAEAVFRRTDYILILMGAALGTTVLSTLMTSQISCGASGVVFGAWGAINIFGLRHKSVLQERYRRYFLRMVVPFSVFTLYVALAVPGVDHWAHMGGLVSGALLGWLLPSRHFASRERRVFKILSMALVTLALLVAPQVVNSAHATQEQALGKLRVSTLARAVATARTHTSTVQAAAYDNGAAVIVAFEQRADTRTLPEATKRFVLDDLATELAHAKAQGMRVTPIEDTTLAGHPAQRISTEVLVGNVHTRTIYVVSVVDQLRYVVSVSAPAFLWPFYGPTLEHALASARLETR